MCSPAPVLLRGKHQACFRTCTRPPALHLAVAHWNMHAVPCCAMLCRPRPWSTTCPAAGKTAASAPASGGWPPPAACRLQCISLVGCKMHAAGLHGSSCPPTQSHSGRTSPLPSALLIPSASPDPPFLSELSRNWQYDNARIVVQWKTLVRAAVVRTRRTLPPAPLPLATALVSPAPLSSALAGGATAAFGSS